MVEDRDRIYVVETKWEHLAEATVNTASGFIISFFLMYMLLWLFNYEATWGKSFWIVSIFTAVSVARNYFWRRFFHNGWHKWWNRW